KITRSKQGGQVVRVGSDDALFVSGDIVMETDKIISCCVLFGRFEGGSEAAGAGHHGLIVHDDMPMRFQRIGEKAKANSGILAGCKGDLMLLYLRGSIQHLGMHQAYRIEKSRGSGVRATDDEVEEAIIADIKDFFPDTDLNVSLLEYPPPKDWDTGKWKPYTLRFDTKTGRWSLSGPHRLQGKLGKSD
ncbi:MAG: hypothetical protein ABH851_07235, partial [Methanobacteriota archaeon]